MELIYLYIKDDGKSIKNCEFNFSSKYRFHFDTEKNYIEYRALENFVPNFWEAENITNITAIIGKNGSGKSNLIEYFIRFCASSSGVGEFNKGVIFIYGKDNSLYTNRPDLKSNYQFLKKHYIQYPLNEFNGNVETKIIYYSPYNEKFISKGIQNSLFDDISNNGFLKSNFLKQAEKVKEKADIEYLQMIDTLRHLWFFKFLKTTVNSFDVKIPNSLSFQIAAENNKQDFLFTSYQNLFNSNESLSFKQQIQNRLLNQIFSDNIENKIKNIDEKNYQNFDEFIENYDAGFFYRELMNLDEKGKVFYKKPPYPLGTYNSYFEFNIKTDDLNDELMKGLYKYHYESETAYEIVTISNHYNFKNKISWEWCGISSGELSNLNLYSRVLESVEISNVTKRNKNIILLLDEAETGLHPEWQRRFLKGMIVFVKEVLKKYKVQIIMASHSPILISDFPSNNIIFLDKDNVSGNCKVVESISRENTFAANIHSLYKNSFFLDEVPIGEFAKDKIKGILTSLEKGEIITELYDQIQLIGEPLIRTPLLEKYYELSNTERLILFHQKEIDRLKQKKND